MLKFLRKYNKLILVVGGSLLMVVFLLPQVPQMAGPSLSEKVAYIGKEPVTNAQLRDAMQELEVARQLAPVLVSGVRLDQRRKAEHWLLLTREAERAGLVGGAGDAQGFLEDSAGMAVDYQIMYAQQQQPQYVQQMLASRPNMIQNAMGELNFYRDSMLRNGATQQSIDRALAKARGVFRLVEATNPGSVYSTREAVAFGHRLNDTAVANVLIIPASKVAESLPNPDEARLAAHFEKFRSVDRTTDPLGIGYLRPAAVKVEWFTLSRSSLLDKLPIDPIEVNKHWRMNKDRFPGEFAAVKAAVEVDYRNAQVERVLEKAEDLVRQELHRSTASVSGDATYKKLPADWAQKMPSLDAIAAKVGADLVREFKLTSSPLTVNAPDGQWKSVDLLQALPGLGAATLRLSNGASITFPLAAINVKELDGDPRFGTQQGLVYGPYRDGVGNLHFFRVNDTRKQGPPESLDEVRQQATNDVKLIDAMAKLTAETDVFLERALANGLESLATPFNATIDTAIEIRDDVVSTSASGVPDRRLDVPEFRTKAMSLARSLDPTRDAATLSPSDRTLAMAIPQARGLVIAQIKAWRPMTAELFRESSAAIRNYANTDLGGRNALAPYTFERLSERLQYKPVRPETTDGEEDADQPADSPPTDSKG